MRIRTWAWLWLGLAGCRGHCPPLQPGHVVAGSYSGNYGWAVLIHPLDAEDSSEVGNSAWTLRNTASIQSAVAQFGSALLSPTAGFASNGAMDSDAALSGVDISDTAKTAVHAWSRGSSTSNAAHMLSLRDSGRTDYKMQFSGSSTGAVMNWQRAVANGGGNYSIQVNAAAGRVANTFQNFAGYIDPADYTKGLIYIDGIDRTSSTVQDVGYSVAATGFDFATMGGDIFDGFGFETYTDYLTLLQHSSLTKAKFQALAAQYYDTRGFGFRPKFTDITPRRAAPGDAMTVVGSGFGQDVAVTIGGIAATASRLDDGTVVVIMPSGVAAGSADMAFTNTESGVTWTETQAVQSITTYQANSERRQGRPITLAVIGLTGGNYKLVDRFDAGSNYNALAYFDSVDPIGFRIEPWSGSSTIGAITLRVHDKGKAISRLISANHVLNRTVELKIGYEGMAEADFFTEYVGRIKAYTQPSPEMWDITVEDVLADLSEKVPKESSTTVVDTAYWTLPTVTSLAVASAFDSTTIPQIYTITQSWDSTNHRDRSFMAHVSANTLRLYQVQSITAGNTFTTWYVSSGHTPLADGVANGQRGELLGDNVVDVMLNVMKRVILPDANIQVATIVYQRDTFLSGIRVRRTLAKPTPALDLLRQLSEISLVSVFPDETNRISGKYFNFPSPHDDVYVLDTSKTNPPGGIVSGPRTDKFANRVVVYGNHDGSQDEKPENFLRVDIFADADSQAAAANAETRTREIKSTWLHSSVTDSAWYNTMGIRVLDRLKYPPRYAKVGTYMDAARVRVADIVDFSHPDVVGQPAAPAANTPGVSHELWQVLEKRTDAPAGHIDLEIWDAQFVYRAAWIGHAGAADWDGASVEEKRHAYIGNTSNLLNTEDGYYIQ